jgi:hypothetical protein
MGYIVVMDGVRQHLTEAEFETKFGHKPTMPRAGEKLFDGQYENASFYTGSINALGLHDGTAVLKNDNNFGSGSF